MTVGYCDFNILCCRTQVFLRTREEGYQYFFSWCINRTVQAAMFWPDITINTYVTMKDQEIPW